LFHVERPPGPVGVVLWAVPVPLNRRTGGQISGFEPVT
jgi:hypothetical protein